MRTSVVIRTYNEERYLAQVLEAIGRQDSADEVEVVLVDSGSTDATLDIARRFGARIEHISRDEFSFGRSLNLGCQAAAGEVLVFVSGHCIPQGTRWLELLTAPVRDGQVSYSYGRQVGGAETKFSERRIFAKYFPETSRLPQEGFFCNNANAAIRRDVWGEYRFDESLSGLEDMELARRIVARGGRIGYVAEAVVAHNHHETWVQVKRRYEREAIALQHIMPEVHLSFVDFIRYFGNAVVLDSARALRDSERSGLAEIFMFRLMQFWGAYRGNHIHRKLSKAKKELYFYPR